MKRLFLYTLLIIAVCSVSAYSEHTALLGRKYIHLVKQDTASPLIVSDVVVVRLKTDKYRIINSPKNYKLLEQVLPPSQRYSTTTNFSALRPEQQKVILELEEILSRTYLAEVKEQVNPILCARMVANNDEIELCEPYFVEHLQGVPNDPYLSYQKVLQSTHWLEALDIADGADSVLIGISDAGFNVFHEDIIDGIAINEGEIENDGIDNDGNGFIDDYYGYNYGDGGNAPSELYNTESEHGTNVLGIIGARINNGKGICGTSGKCKLVPIRILGDNDDYLYCYESLLYAVARGCKVVNCSWGSVATYSETNKSLIEYVTACGVSIVSAAGNLSAIVSDNYAAFYPAVYYGVLGVGETDENEVVPLSSAIRGVGLRIVCQGLNNYATTNSGGYKKVASGSSYASPAVAGLVGILRSAMPELTAIEAVERLRVTGDDIRSVNGNSGFIPVRANLLNALTTPSPSVIMKEQYFHNILGEKIERLFAGDTCTLILKLVNILDDANSLNITLEPLSVLYDEAFEILFNEENIVLLKHNEEYELKIKMYIKDPSKLYKAFYLCKMTANDGAYIDDFKFEISIPTKLTTISNDKLIASVTDDGIVGYEVITSTYKYGNGITHKEYGGFLYGGGFTAVVDYTKVVSTDIDGKNNYDGELVSADDKYVSINLQENAVLVDDKAGISINIQYTFPSKTSPTILATIRAKNVKSGNIAIENLSVGQFFDWDVKNSGRNNVAYFPDAIPLTLGPNYAAAEYITNEYKDYFVGSLAWVDKTKYSSVTPSAAGCTENVFKKATQLYLTSGIQHQTSLLTDAAYLIGMQFNKQLKKDEEVECYVCTGVEKTKEKLADALKECYHLITSITDTANLHDEIKQYAHTIEITLADYSLGYVRIFDILGNLLYYENISQKNTYITMQNYAAGAYLVVLDSGGLLTTKIVYKR